MGTIPNQPAPSGQGSWVRSNQGIAALLAAGFVALLIYLWMQEWTHRELRDGFSLGFFSLAGAGTCLVCALVMMVDRQKRDTEEDMATVGTADWLFSIVILGVMYVFFEAAWTFGFALVAPVFLFVATYALGGRPLRTAAISAIATTAGISIAFWVIGIDLPLPFFLTSPGG
ncbi:MAG: tripartite tricarboxylate transporter TctB family protein [Alphaproteobacteria bacterium]